jgi:hypothetical protein
MNLHKDVFMANRVTVWWQGQEYDAIRQDGLEVGAGPGEVWQLLHDGAPVTSFPAERDEAGASVKEKILEWLDANRSRPALDVGRQ